MIKRVERDPQGTKGINPNISRREIPFTIANQGHKGLNKGATRDTSQGAHMNPRKRNYKASVELCTALGWEPEFLDLSSYVFCTRPVGPGPYYQFLESQEPDSHGRPAGLTLFHF